MKPNNYNLHISYRNFEEAKQFARSLELKNTIQWKEYCKTDLRPKDVPTNPNRQYQEEWQGWSDFLGTSNLSAKERKERLWSFEKAREYAQSSGIKSKTEWCKFARTSQRPEYIPSEPRSTYKDQFISWGDWLGTGRISDNKKHEQYYTYKQTKEYLKQFNFQNENEFYEWTKTSQKHDLIPAHPRTTYKVDNTWISMGDFLSNGNLHTKEFLSYNLCKQFAQSLNFMNHKEWFKWCLEGDRPNYIPGNPQDYYKTNFEGWPEFLGYERKISYGEKIIEGFLRYNKVYYRSQSKFNNCRIKNPLPFDFGILKNNEIIACIEYNGIQHYESVDFMGGQDKLDFVQLSDQTKKTFCDINNIPLLTVSYKDEDNIENILIQFLFNIFPDKQLTINSRKNKQSSTTQQKYMDFEELKKYVQKHNIKKVSEFWNWWTENRPENAPFTVDYIYSKLGQWTTWGEFLGTGKVQSKKAEFVSYEEFKKWFRESNIKNGLEWREARKTKPAYIPSHPEKIYSEQWKGWKNFL